LSALLSLLAAAGCGHGAVVGADPKFAPCREVVALDGGPVPEVRWFGPGQDDEVVRHFEWCRAVGPLVVARPDGEVAGTGNGEVAGTGRRPDGLAVDSLAIVSFNVNLGAASAIELVDSVRSGAFTAGAPVTDFVLLLQETIREGDDVPDRVPKGSGTGRGRFPAPRTGPRLDVVRMADSLRLHLFYGPAMRSGKGRNPRGLAEDRGNAMLSTLPLSRLVMVELPFGGARRIAQLGTVSGRTRSGRAWSLQIGNLHFDVGPIGPSALSAIRARQARAIAQIADSSGAVVVGGDLNAFSLRGTAESVKILRRAFPETLQGDSLPTRGPQRLDFLFFRLPEGFETSPYRTLPFGFGSDHRPVIGWVRFAD
jgi:endonuclease/exonuclease/phosphatase family metal-dependent hydrolase